MNKEQSLAILERAKKRIMNMTEQEKKQMSKRIDDFFSQREDEEKMFYEHSKFEIEFEKNSESVQKRYSMENRFIYDDNKKINYDFFGNKVA